VAAQLDDPEPAARDTPTAEARAHEAAVDEAGQWQLLGRLGEWQFV
jgi:hypothetical protein